MSKDESRLPWVVGIIAILAVAAVLVTAVIVMGQTGARNGQIRERLAAECIRNGGIWLDDHATASGARGCLR